jgi:cytochrome c oxidase subunit 2
MIRGKWMGVSGIAIMIAILLVSSGVKSAATQSEAQEITVSAKKFDFTPADIQVKNGSRVRLNITAADRDHGIEINAYADGADKKGEPGLKFDASVKKPEFKLPKDRAVQVEFVAVQAGTYSFKCSEFCGTGHRNMKGTIIVEP